MDTASSKIQRIEVDGLYWADVFCPFCGQQVISIEDGEFEFAACPHTLFHCVEEGFGFRSSLFDKNMGIEGIDDYDIQVASEHGYDYFTDQCTVPNSLKFVSQDVPPSMDVVCIGFALLD